MCSVLEPYYNVPKLSTCATWSPYGITFPNSSSIGYDSVGIFITLNDTVYVAIRGLHQVQMWLRGSNTTARVFNTNESGPCDVFVTDKGDIYVDNGAAKNRVDRWTVNASSAMTAMNVNSSCYGLFVDINNYLYCSSETPDQVIKRWLDGPLNSSTLVAGNGIKGNTSEMLNGSRGIFVDRNLNLYVADLNNDRVQHFSYNQSSGITVVGNGATDPMPLSKPIDVTLDADGHIFVVDYGNHRIIASGPYGFRCIVGCTGISGAAANQLNHPAGLSFDSEGNLIVTDGGNSRVQSFALATNSCGKHVDFCTPYETLFL